MIDYLGALSWIKSSGLMPCLLCENCKKKLWNSNDKWVMVTAIYEQKIASHHSTLKIQFAERFQRNLFMSCS